MPGVSRDELKASIRKLNSDLQARDASLQTAQENARTASLENVDLKAAARELHAKIGRLEQDLVLRDSVLHAAIERNGAELQKHAEVQQTQEQQHERLTAALQQQHRDAVAALQRKQQQLAATVQQQQHQLDAAQQQQLRLAMTAQRQQQQLLAALQQLVDAQRQLLAAWPPQPQPDEQQPAQQLPVDTFEQSQEERSPSASDVYMAATMPLGAASPLSSVGRDVTEGGAGEHLATAELNGSLLALADGQQSVSAKRAQYAAEAGAMEYPISKHAKTAAEEEDGPATGSSAAEVVAP